MVITSRIKYKYADAINLEFNLLEQLTIVICSNKLNDLKKCYGSISQNIGSSAAQCIMYYDEQSNPDVFNFASSISNPRHRIIINESNMGLSYCRNEAMELCDTNYLLFLDDDVEISLHTMVSIANEFELGNVHIAGVQIQGSSTTNKLPFYILPGQIHYLGIHNSLDRKKVPWGACMAIDLGFCRSRNIKFNEKLGRRQNALQSGDDTTFIHDVQLHDGSVVFFTNLTVMHNINPNRISFRYMIRRTFWQGRSEVIRGNAGDGVRKETYRYMQVSKANLVRMLIVSLFYFIVLISGIAYQKLLNEFNYFRLRQHFGI